MRKSDYVRYDKSNETVVSSFDDSELNNTGFKVLQNYKNNGLIRAMKSQLNGKVRLIYDVKDMVPFSDWASRNNEEAFCEMIKEFQKAYKEIRENGFFDSKYIIIDENLIFVDSDNRRCYMIYLPIFEKMEEEETEDLGGNIDEELKDMFQRVIQSNEELCRGRVQRFYEALNSSEVSLEGAIEELDSEDNTDVVFDFDKIRMKVFNKEKREGDYSPETWLSLTLISNMNNYTVKVPPFGAVIGRIPGHAQVVIKESSISREHCKFSKKGDEWLIEDLNSKNHTWLNNKRLMPGMKELVHEGDVVTISKYAFKVHLESENENDEM